MRDMKLVPKRRFKEFKEEWKTLSFDEVLTVNSGRDYKHLNVGNIPVHGTGGLMLYVDDKLSEDDSIGIGRKGTIDKPQLLKAPFWTVDTLFFMTPHNNVNLYFLFSKSQTIDWRKMDESTGVPSLSKNTIEKIWINMTCLKEQQKIGEFFKQLDQMISLEKRKLEKTKALKSAYLAEMFPAEGERVPKRRFAGFNDEWKQQKLNKVADYRSGKAHERNVVDNGEYIIVNSKFVSTNGRTKKFSNIQIEPLKKGELAFVLSDIPNGKALAKTLLIDRDNLFTLNQRIAGITPKENTDSYFLKELMNRHEYFLKFDGGVGQTNLSNADLENFESSYPSFEEQKRIGNFFKQLEYKIVTQQQKLDKLKAMKQAYLQEMFV